MNYELSVSLKYSSTRLDTREYSSNRLLGTALSLYSVLQMLEVVMILVNFPVLRGCDRPAADG